MQDAIKHLRMALANVKVAKAMIRGHVEGARLLISEEVKHEAEGLITQIESDAATAGVHMNEFGRMTVGSKRFAVKK